MVIDELEYCCFVYWPVVWNVSCWQRRNIYNKIRRDLRLKAINSAIYNGIFPFRISLVLCVIKNGSPTPLTRIYLSKCHKWAEMVFWQNVTIQMNINVIKICIWKQKNLWKFLYHNYLISYHTTLVLHFSVKYQSILQENN